MEQEEQEKMQERRDSQNYQGTSQCKYCKSDTYDDVVKAAVWGERGLVAIEDIPARVCEGCTEQFYDDETARKIEKVIADPAVKAKQEILVPVFSLAEVQVPKRRPRPEVLDEEETEAIESMFTGMEQGRQETEEDQESQEAFLCQYCQSNTYEDVVKSALWGGRGLVAIEDIPARVCKECREQFYDEETNWKIDKLIEHGFPAVKAKQEIVVPVVSLAEVS